MILFNGVLCCVDVIICWKSNLRVDVPDHSMANILWFLHLFHNVQLLISILELETWCPSNSIEQCICLVSL